MHAFKHSFVFYLFFVCCLGLLISQAKYFSVMKNELNLLKNQTVPKSKSGVYFSNLKYYLVEDGGPKFYLEATELKSDGLQSKTVFFNPIGTLYSKNYSEIDFSSITGILDKENQLLVLDDTAVLSTKSSKILADSIKYQIDKDILNGHGDIKTYHFSLPTGDKINIFSDKLLSYPRKKQFFYSGNCRGKIDRKRKYEDDISFKASNIDLFVDDMIAKLDGNVIINRGQMSASSLRGEIYLENYNKKLKYYVMYDDVKVDDFVKSENGNVLKRKAFSEKLEGIVSEDKIILTGYPKVFQGKDIVKGNKITIRDNNEVIEVDDANTNVYMK